MEGTQLLTTMRDTVPKMVKIIVTGYPSQENTKEALNKGADAYVVKPILNIQEFLNTLKEHLKKQKETQQYSEQKVAEYIESRAKGEETKEKTKENQTGKR
jgi:YesN/AraC family two-component response regulator